MMIELSKLKSNPFRDLAVDPIDADNVKALTQSIKEDGFWGGVVARKFNGHYEIAAGHHRVEAALKAGIKSADVFVGKLDDAAMIRIYARENATQRGNSSTALAGSVASALKFLAKAILTGAGYVDFNITAEMRGNIASSKGVGREVVTRFLRGVPGITENVVNQQLVNLKSSGDYARIITEVREQIEEENRAAIKELERAEKERIKAEEIERKAIEAQKEANRRAKDAREAAARKRAYEAQKTAEANAKLAKKRREEMQREAAKFDALRITRDTARKADETWSEAPVTFDFEGCAKHFKKDSQVQAFRTAVTGQGVAPWLPVNKQGSLAKEVVRLAKDTNHELSAAFIKSNVIAMALKVRGKERQISGEEKRRILEKDAQAKMKTLQQDFSRNARGLGAAGQDIIELIDKHSDITFYLSGEFQNAVTWAEKVVTKLKKEVM